MIRFLAMSEHFSAAKAVFLLIFSLISTQIQAGSDTFIDFEATLGADDNVTRAKDAADIEHDSFLTVAATGGQMLLETRSGSLSAKVLLEAIKT